MPPVSRAQRAAMHAAAEGHSTLGIPKKVGEEFDEADPGGKLPKKKPAKKDDESMAKRIMRAFKLNEISAVDRPAQEGARMVLMKRDDDVSDSVTFNEDGDIYWKREFNASQRQAAASSGAAEPDGSYPIKNKGDLHNAMQAIGRSKNPSKTRAHIRARAKSLGLESELSDSFKREPSGVLSMDITEDQLNKMIQDAVASAQQAGELKLSKAVDELAKAETDIAVSRLPEAHKAYYDNLPDEARRPFLSKSSDDRAVEIEKAQPKLSPDLQKMLDEAKANEIILKGLLEDRDVQKYAKKAVEIGLQEIHGEVLRKAYKGDEKAIGKLEELFKGLTEQVRTGKLFSEFGTHNARPASAADEMNAKVDELVADTRKAGKSITKERAFVEIYENSANADLKKRFDIEDFRKRQMVSGVVA
jgi:hypothetical protein